jgi:hypothetical protein
MSKNLVFSRRCALLTLKRITTSTLLLLSLFAFGYECIQLLLQNFIGDGSTTFQTSFKPGKLVLIHSYIEEIRFCEAQVLSNFFAFNYGRP